MMDDEESLVLDCYRLARWYHTSPTQFLDMPLSEIAVHMRRTAELSRIMREAQERDREDE